MNRTSTFFQRIAHAVAIAAVLGLSVPPSFAADPTGTAGGGSCSVWQSIKSAATGVHCSYL